MSMLKFEQSSEADDRHPTWLAVAEDVTWKIQCEKGFGGDGNCQILKKLDREGYFRAMGTMTSPEPAMVKAQELHEDHLQFDSLHHRVLDKMHKNGLPGLTIQAIEKTHDSIKQGQGNFSSPDENLVALELHRELDKRYQP